MELLLKQEVSPQKITSFLFYKSRQSSQFMKKSIKVAETKEIQLFCTLKLKSVELILLGVGMVSLCCLFASNRDGVDFLLIYNKNGSI